MTAPDPRDRPLRRSDLEADPLRQFTRWFEEAGGIAVPEAAALATAARNGRPSVRMVLVKGFDERGFVFHTSYDSRKAHELGENPRAALLFHWHPLGRQVRVEGEIARVSEEESDLYFATRPPAARLAAWASRQSEVLESRVELEARFTEAAQRYRGEVPRPPFWGGFRLAPAVFEFWQHRADRLHDRFRYRHAEGGWVLERLSP